MDEQRIAREEVSSPPRPALGSASILVVHNDAESLETLAVSLEPYVVFRARDADEAWALLEREEINLILVDHRLPGKSGAALLRDVMKRHPDLKRLLTAEYADLPQLVKLRADDLVYEIIPQPLRPLAVRHVVEEALFGAELGQFGKAFNRERAVQLLKWTVREIIKIKGMVIRQLPPNKNDLQLQFVLPDDYQVEDFMGVASLQWKKPLKARGVPLPSDSAGHAVIRMLGRLDPAQGLFAREITQESMIGTLHTYVAILPWRREAKVTVAVGFLGTDQDPVLRPILEELHKLAVAEVPSFVLPKLRDKLEDNIQYTPEYDWVVTEQYVGPDRRERATTFLNRYVLIGNRARILTGMVKTGEFVDRLSPAAKSAVKAYIALSLIDTLFTYVFVRSGLVSELNPVLRPLIYNAPVLFIVVKNLMSLSAIMLIVRFELWRIGRVVLGLNVAVYAALDVYWLTLLMLHAARCK